MSDSANENLKIEDLESKIVKQAIEHADLMMLSRLKFLKRESADVISEKIKSLETKIEESTTKK